MFPLECFRWKVDAIRNGCCHERGRRLWNKTGRIFLEQDDSLKNRGQDERERELKKFSQVSPKERQSNGKVWKCRYRSSYPPFFLSFLHACPSLFHPLPPFGGVKQDAEEPSRGSEGWLTQFPERSLMRTSLKISTRQLGILLNFYSYRFKARSEIYRANICLIFKMQRLQGVL